jgi:hypothetical protein
LCWPANTTTVTSKTDAAAVAADDEHNTGDHLTPPIQRGTIMSNDNTTNVNSNDDTEGHAVIRVRPFLPDAEVADDTEGNCFKYGTDLPDDGSVRQAADNKPSADGDDTEGHFGRYVG